MSHESVLLQEAIDGLAIKPDGIYVDGTFGRGGHSQVILNSLSSQGRLFVIDKDKVAIDYAKTRFGSDKRVTVLHGSFANLHTFMQEAGIAGSVNGVLLDLGVSSPQLDEAERGFSFLQEGPLDMRMDRENAFDAATFINKANEKDLIRVFRDYGEERFAGRIARAIVRERAISPITTTLQLANIVKAANPRWEKHKHPATRVFQAVRIHVNQELEDLKEGLEQSFKVLGPEGRLVVISFHSLEDRVVKQFMRHKEDGEKPPPYLPIRDIDLKKEFVRRGKAIKPSEDEIRLNPRARSAVLRIGEKVA